MFAFFVNGEFYSFWQNKKGQIFFDLTCNGLDLNPSQVDLNYYPIKNIPDLFAFNEEKELLIQSKVTTTEIIDEVEQTTETIEIVQTLVPEKFVVAGQKLLAC